MFTFDEIKTKVFDGSGIAKNNEWLWEEKNGVYYPASRLTDMDIRINNTIAEIKEGIATKGIYTTSSCDMFAYGWNGDRHNALHTIKRRGIAGLHIESSVKFGVTDWTITKVN